MRKGLMIELIDPVITSASPASTTVAQALPYIPGAMLLGAAAARGYRAGMSPDDAFDTFHAGTVKFDDGLPVDKAGHVGLPNPLSWHYPKGKNAFNDKTWRDLATEAPEAGLEQLREEAIAAGMTRIEVKSSATLRTAIDRNTGRAAESRLFGYQMLDAGQRFFAGIEAPDEGAMQQACNALFGAGNTTCELLLGRSKSGEFGRVKLHLCAPHAISVAVAPAPGTAYFWCLSDLWAYDSAHQPTIAPAAGFFGGADIDWNHSFTRHRRFSPYNAKWRKRAPERLLIQRGSVFTLKGNTLAPGVYRFGLGQEQGYGRVLVSAEPPLQALKELDAQKVSCAEETSNETGEASDLANWLRAMNPRGGLNVDRELEALQGHYHTSKRIAGYPVGPAASQWGSLASLLRQGKDVSEFLDAARSTDERAQWGAIFGTERDANFKSYVLSVIRAKGPDHAALLAKEIRNWLGQKGWFDGT